MNGKDQVAAWNRWLESAEGRNCAAGKAEGKYLENRLLCAFNAGIAACPSRDVLERMKEIAGIVEACIGETKGKA